MTDEALARLFRLDDKVVVVTGALGLLGRKHCEAIAAYGGSPVMLDLHQSELDEFARELKQRFSVDAVGYSVDITSEAAIAQNSQTVIERFGSIHGLVNNAANNPKMEQSNETNFSRLENFPMEVWQQDIAVGLTGSYLCAKYYGTEIARNGQGGSIVNISSDLGIMAPDQRLYRHESLEEHLQPVKPVTYSVVKTALVGLTRYLATYWADKNVRCNAICPGGVENGQPEAFLNAIATRIPMGRMARADEYQGVLIWMLSEASSYLNGSIVPVEGGRSTW